MWSGAGEGARRCSLEMGKCAGLRRRPQASAGLSQGQARASAREGECVLIWKGGRARAPKRKMPAEPAGWREGQGGLGKKSQGQARA
jgi:hypothetical protein